MLPASHRTIAAAVKERHAELASLLGGARLSLLTAPSRLPGWDRLTVICHLRYGAEANVRMTKDILEGVSTAFYPDGPEQRPETLIPRSGETAQEVVTSLAANSAGLDQAWEGLGEPEWELPLIEPGGNEDLGSITLGHMALLRLTEVEVHGTDLDIGAHDWSDVFVAAALPMRVHWLATRRPKPESADYSIFGTWVLAADDGEAFSVTATPQGVEFRNEQTAGAEVARLQGTRRALLAFLLGRISIEELDVSGNTDLAARFRRAFPGP